MIKVENIVKQSARPVGRTTVGKLLAAFGLFLLVVLVFGYITDEVLEGDTQSVDLHVLQFIHTFANPFLTEVIKSITLFGGLTMISLFTVVLLIFLLQMGKWRGAVFTAFTMGGTLVTFTLLKLLFERQRPFLYNFVTESTYSFPSGHASLSCALALTLIVLTWHTKWRRYIVVGGIMYVILIAFSRMYLAVHYPTDVIAGWFIAGAWVIVVASLVDAIRWPLFKKAR